MEVHFTPERLIRGLILAASALLLARSGTEARAQSSLDQMLAQARQMDGTSDVKVEILENGRHASYDCHGHNARLMGNRNVVSFHNCNTVSVPGNHNTVTVMGARTIKTYGNSNQVTWSGDEQPQIDNPGTANEIQRGAGPASPVANTIPTPRRAPPPSGRILIDQSTQRDYDMACNGRDVQVSAGIVNVMLHGSCGRVLVDGAMDQVTFDEASSLSVTGSNNRIHWGKRPASVSNNGTANTVGSR